MDGASKRPYKNGYYGGDVVIPYNSKKSLLMQFVEGKIETPTTVNHVALSDAQLLTLNKWIEDGAKNYQGIPSFETPDYTELFSEEKAIIGRLKKVFLMVAGAAVQKYGPKMEEHQQLLIAASDILIEIYMAESTILRTEKNAKRTSEKEQAVQIAMSKLYLYNAVSIVEGKGKESIISFAEGDEQRMMLMGLKRFTKYTNFPDIVDLRNEIAEKVKAENKYCF